MKKVSATILLVILLSLLPLSGDVSAQGPAGDWISSIYCINQEDTEGAISLSFYEEGSSVAIATMSDVIDPLKSKYYYPSDLNELSSFAGSVLVSSSTNISCSVQTSTSAVGTQGDPFMYGASGGFSSSSAAPVMYASQVLKNFSSGEFGWYESYLAIQNTSSSDVTVQVEYSDRAMGKIPAATRQYTIKSQSGKIVYLEENNDLPLGFLGSAKVSSISPADTALAVQAVFYNDGSSYKKAQFHVYNGTPQGESKLYAPFVMRNFYDFNAGINVVNVGDTKTSFKIVFTIGRSSVQTYTYQLPREINPDELVAFFLPDIDELDPVDKLLVSERAGSAIIYATDLNGNLNPSGQLIANINFRNDGRDSNNRNFGGQAVTYNAVGDSQASQTMFIPNIQNEVGNAKFTSGINVANLTSTSGSCTYTFVDDSTVSWTQPLPPNGIYSILVSNIPDLDKGYSSGAMINCNVNAIAIITMRANASSYWGDSQTAINALISE